jgi:hypothetical protein
MIFTRLTKRAATVRPREQSGKKVISWICCNPWHKRRSSHVASLEMVEAPAFTFSTRGQTFKR